MNLVDRVKNILLTPKTEWDVIAAETTPPKQLIVGYVLPLAVLAAICGFISSAIIGTTLLGATYRTPIVWGIAVLILQIVMAVVSVYVVAFVIDALAPSFGAQKNFNQALKIPAYCFTAAWIGAVFAIIPWIGWLIAILISLYGFYLLYLALPKLMRNPDDKTILYTVVVVIVTFVVMFIVNMLIGMIAAGGAMMGASAMGPRVAPNVTFDADSRAGKMNEFARKMEEAGRKMEAAQKSGDSSAQMAAAMGTLGTALSGGKGVDPVQLEALKPFVPDTFAGLPRTDLRTDRSGVAGLMTAKAEGVYGDATGKRASLEVTDTGGAAGLMGLASWMGVQGEKESADRRESTRKEGNRLVHEEVSKRGGKNKYMLVLNDRFVVSAEGTVDIAALKSGVSSLDLKKIEALK
jgi:hypothetical protein